jgi:hypothetical protein
VRTSWSSHGRVFEVGDICKEEALKYLEDRGVEGEQASQIYELFGGRMIHLKRSADEMEAGSTVQSMCIDIM